MNTIKVNDFELKVNDQGKVEGYRLKYYPRLKKFKATNNYLDLEYNEAVSYEWWTYAKKIKGQWVFNNHNYSMSTCKHQCQMRTLLSQLGIDNMIYINMRQSLNNSSFQSDALISFYSEMLLLQLRVKEKRTRTIESDLEQVNRLKMQIKQLRKLGARFSVQQIKELKKSIATNEQTRLENARIKRQQYKERNKQMKLLVKKALTNPVIFELGV